MARATDQRQLISLTATLNNNTTYKIKGEPTRTFIYFQVEENSKGFDVGLVRRGTPIAEENYIDAVGKATAANPKSRYTIEGGCGGDIYIRDTDNPAPEAVVIVTDVPVEIEEVI